MEQFPNSDVEIDLSTQNIFLNINEVNNNLIVKDDAYYKALGYGVVGAGKTNITKADYTAASSTTKVKIADGVEVIEEGAFANCTNITEVIFPSSLKEIKGQECVDNEEYGYWTLDSGTGAFSGCTGLTELNLNEGLEYIGGYAFSGCTGLTEVTIPSTVKYLGFDDVLGQSGQYNQTAICFSVFYCCTVLEITEYGESDDGGISAEISRTNRGLQKIIIKAGMQLDMELPDWFNPGYDFAFCTYYVSGCDVCDIGSCTVHGGLVGNVLSETEDTVLTSWREEDNHV